MRTSPGALFVRRVQWWAEKRARKPRNAALNLGELELTRAYRGIDGRPWPQEVATTVAHEDGLASIECWPTLQALAADNSGQHVYDAVILARSLPASFDLPGVEFLGFDFGFYNDDFSIFSSIFHEAIHSPIVELRAHALQLNKSILLPGWSEVEAYSATRARLLAEGRDVERAAECYPIAIFGKRRQSH